MKRICACILSVLLLALSAACRDSNAPQANATPEPTPREPITFVVGLWDVYTADQDAESAQVQQYLIEKFNITLEPWLMSDQDYKQQLASAGAAGNLPDMFAYDSYDWDFLQGVIDDGQLRALPLEPIADYPNIEALLARNQRQQVRNQAIYSIPRPATALQATPGGTMAFYYRLDWADTLDITVDGAPNWEEFWHMLSAFAHDDPDGDWNNNTWGLTLGGNLYEAFLMPFGVRDFVLEAGTWQLGLTSARARDALQWARQAFREGLLDADFATQSLDESMRKFCDGEAGIAMLDASIGGAYGLQQMWQQRQPEKEITEYLAVLPQPITPSGISYNAAERCTSGTFFSARMDDTRMQRAYELFDWLLSEPGLQLARFGRSHTTQDGRIQSTLTDEQGQPIPFIDAGKAWSRMGVLATYAQDYAPELDPQGFAATAQAQLIQTYWPNNWRQGMFTLCALNGRPPTAQDAPVRQAISDLLTQPGDADTLWEAYVATIDTLCDRAALEQAAAQAAQSLGITTEE